MPAKRKYAKKIQSIASNKTTETQTSKQNLMESMYVDNPVLISLFFPNLMPKNFVTCYIKLILPE